MLNTFHRSLVAVLTLSIGVAHAPAAISFSSSQGSPDRYGNLTVTWTVIVPPGDAIHSIHFEPGLGANDTIGGGPAGWTAGPGLSWSAPTPRSNAHGTFTFSATYGGLGQTVTWQNMAVSVDYWTNPTNLVPITAPGTPTSTDWVQYPTPAPGTLALLGIATPLLTRRRRVS